MSSASIITAGPLKKRKGPRREPRQQTANMAELDSPAKNTRRRKGNTQQSEAHTPAPTTAPATAPAPPPAPAPAPAPATAPATAAIPAPTLSLSDEIPNNSEGSQEQKQSQSQKKETAFRPRKAMRRMLTPDEEDMVTWLREHTFLYDKSSAEFKMREKKSRAWHDKEAELNLNPGDLSGIWYPNMRTQFSKLIKTSRKSGSGMAELTARQEWIINKFEFIRPFLVQLRHQRGSNFAEKRKELERDDSDDGDAASDLSLPSTASTSRRGGQKAARELSSLTSELESVRGAISGARDAAAQSGQFLVYLMRQMDQQRMNSFVTRATRLALDLVDENQEEKRQQAAQSPAPQEGSSMITSIPSHPLPGNKRWFPTTAAAPGSAGQQQQHFGQQQHQQLRQQQQLQDFQLATNVAAAAPPAHLTPQMSYYSHLQPPNVQPFLMEQQGSSFPTGPTVTSASVIRRAMDIACTPNSSLSLSQETLDGDFDEL